ncbi:MAG: site-specific integrase, partial [Porphyromonadaceae bacterium]|nr:site-specific integrase [Porphyromonadaceae bacterium]
MLPDDIRTQFLSHLRFELGLSENTCEAYLSDVDKLLSYMDVEGLSIEAIDYPRLQHFIATLHDLGIGPTSISRIISGIRSFGRYLLLEGYVDSDPTALLEVPRKGRYLPTVLTTAEVDRIIEAAGSKGGVEGQRNRAIIEVLFSCGLRVSELCHLTFPDLFLDEGYLRVRGKGSTQRL